jgi:APA family basic amino acid/polyamine antiporter
LAEGQPAASRPGIETSFRLAKAVGALTIAASAVSQEYGAGINFVAVQSLGAYPRVEGLAPLAMFATGILLLPKVYLFARYGREMPRAGSTYVWIARGLNLPLSFVVSFLWWLGVTAGGGFLSFTFGTFLGQALIGAGIGAGRALLTTPGHIVVGLAAIWLVYWVHRAGVRQYGLFVSILLFVILATALTIMAYGFATAPSQLVSAAGSAAHVALSAPVAPPGPSLGAFLSVCTLFVFAYGGLNAAPALGGEARDAGRAMPRGIYLGWAIALVLFTLVALSLFSAAPWWAVVALIHEGKSAYVTAPGLVSLVAPHAVGAVLNLVVAIIVGKTIAPGMLASSRLLFAWAQDGVLPDAFAATSERKVPVAALTLSALLASFFLLESALVGWSIGVVLRSLTILLVLAVLAVATLNLKWNRRFAGVGWAAPIASGGGVVVASLLGIAIAAVLVASVAVVPKTPLAFQPLFQGAVATLIALWIYAAGRARAAARGVELAAVAAAPPLE